MFFYLGAQFEGWWLKNKIASYVIRNTIRIKEIESEVSERSKLVCFVSRKMEKNIVSRRCVER